MKKLFLTIAFIALTSMSFGQINTNSFKLTSPFGDFQMKRGTSDLIFKRALTVTNTGFQSSLLTINYNGDFSSGVRIQGPTTYITGKVGIKTENPDAELTVNGDIHAKEVKVDLNIPADYVFEKYYTGISSLKKNYTMPTLDEIEVFTKENNHLPGIPSAKEIQENGLQVGEMTNLLLQKIEELTLYTIEQEKRIKALEESQTKN